jgi:hypothetical protein
MSQRASRRPQLVAARATGVKLVLNEGWLQLIDFFASATV